MVDPRGGSGKAIVMVHGRGENRTTEFYDHFGIALEIAAGIPRSGGRAQRFSRTRLQYPHDWAARIRQDHARQATGGHPAAADVRRIHRDHQRTQHRRILPGGGGLLGERPFRAPHHTISDAGLIGGSSGMARPGEVSLAYQGLLFLDEFPAINRLIGAEEDGPVERRYSFPVGILLGS
jgi:hypothetical protein